MSVLKYKDLETGKWVATGGGAGGSGGADGFSPVANVTQTDTGATITITDKKGTTTATVSNGKDGKDGKTAYQHAQDGGYAGTEEAFAEKLAAQPNWNAAEGVPGHVLNRTHWVDVEESVLHEETVTVSNNMYMNISGETIPFVLGDTYTVEWEGTAYECVCKAGTFNGMNTLGVGNEVLFGSGENTGEPFLIASIEGAGWGVVSAVDGEYSFKVIGKKYIYHTIPPEYLAGSKPYFIEVDISRSPYTTNATQTEVLNALLSGYQLVAGFRSARYMQYYYYAMGNHYNDRSIVFYSVGNNGSGNTELDVETMIFTPNDAGGYDISRAKHRLGGVAVSAENGVERYLLGSFTSDDNMGIQPTITRKCYIGTDDCLYSGGKKVATVGEIEALIDTKLGVIENGAY